LFDPYVKRVTGRLPVARLFACWDKNKESWNETIVQWEITREKVSTMRDIFGYRDDKGLMELFKDRPLVDDLKKNLRKQGLSVH
jgi:hypothetical protein